MKQRGLSGTDIAAALAVDKATISRSLSTKAFSQTLRWRVADLIRRPVDPRTTERLLQDALRLLRTSDRLRANAERMIAEALDRSTGTE